MKFTFKKPTKHQVLRFLKYALLVVLGNAITAAGTSFFIIPNGFVVGGTTGWGIFVQQLIGEDNPWREWIVNITVYVANIILFLIGAIMVGRKFAAGTLAGTLLYPGFMSVFKIVNDLYVKSNGGLQIGHDQPLLACIFGGLLFGLGIGIATRIGASTGGTDIPPVILHKFFGTPISVSLWCIDTITILMQFAVIRDVTILLYGILITILSSIVIGFVSPIGMKKTQVKIISKEYREIRELIINKLNRGVTVLYGQTGFLKERCYVLLTIVSNRELVKLKNEVQKIDPTAFMTISIVSEVRGRGFSVENIDLPREAEVQDDLIETELPPAKEGTPGSAK